MKHHSLSRRCSALKLASLLFGVSVATTPATAYAQQNSGSSTLAALEQLSGAPLVTSRSPFTGVPTYIGTNADHPMKVPVSPLAPAADRAAAFLDLAAPLLGLASSKDAELLATAGPDEVAMEHVRYRQTYKQITVASAELVVHVRGASVLSFNGHTLPGISVETTPTVDAAQAKAVALRSVEKEGKGVRAFEGAVALSEPKLEILNVGFYQRRELTDSRLAWFIEATGLALRRFIWIDAHDGRVLQHFSQLTNARHRLVHSAGGGSSLPGTLVRSEGQGPSSEADVDKAYDYSGDTYDYYFDSFARDSYDDAGATLSSTVDWCDAGACGGCPCQNAFWDGTQMIYGDGFPAADDVVAHELTHAVTEHSANLVYCLQSGALNESFSDIFGETVDLNNSGGTDTTGVRWLLGEDVPGIGAIRSLQDPTAFGDPGKVSDPQYFCAASCSDWDNGGVHTNSGVPNHAFFLMVDGGTYNGFTVTGIGLPKAGKIQYRALTQYLTSGASLLDDYNALNQSCQDLIGTDGITADDCNEVMEALQAVEMDGPICGVTVCGNGVVEPGEVCDDGNAVNCDGCDANCTVTGCGNGITACGESCDDGNTTGGDGCETNCALSTGCAFYNAADVPQNIPDLGSVTSTISVLGHGAVVDVNVIDLEGTHTFVSDLQFQLARPLGSAVSVINRVCGSAANFDLGLDDEAGTVMPCPPTDGLSHIPSGSLAEFDGEDGFGDWVLTISDHAGADSGTLNSWGLLICTGCGNGDVDAGEDCDDGNLTDGDGCDSNCTVTACGNGIVTSPEVCDDGNLVGGDGCDASCNAEPRSYAMVANHGSASVTVFDTITDTVLGSVALGAGNILDCSIPSTASFGYVGNFANGIHVIDLAAVPPVLAGGTNPIVSSIATEDTSVTKDGQFLVSCNGGDGSPVSVMNLGSRIEVSTFYLPSGGCTGVDVCDDGSVLTAEFYAGAVRRLLIDSAGNLTDTGESLVVTEPLNVVCGKDGASGVAVSYSAANVQSFTIPGLAPVATRSLTGGEGFAAVVSSSGNRIAARGFGAVDLFTYDSASGALGAAPLLSIPTSGLESYLGVDQLALNPSGTKIYVSEGNAVNVYDSLSGALLTSITDPAIVSATGICVVKSVCGNGLVEGGEDCEDGNSTDGDGCDSNCTFTGCGNRIVTDGEVCDGGSSTNDCCTAACAYESAATPCADDGEACTLDQCDAAGTCLHPSGPDGVACPDDGDACTLDQCASGTCSHPAGNDGAACPDDGDACTLDQCAAGTCSHPAGNDGAACPDDGDVCTLDQCASGTCEHPAGNDGAVCQDDGEECTLDLCASGSCVHPSIPDGTPCDDSDGCSVGDTCAAGACSGASAVVCCNGGTCHPGPGTCSFCPEGYTPGGGGCQRSYPIDATLLDNLDSDCGDGIDRHNGGSGAYGFHWADAGDERVGPVLRVDLRIEAGISCSGDRHNLYLNGNSLPMGSYLPAGYCDCYSAHDARFVGSDDVGSYVKGGTNAVLTEFVYSTDGLSQDANGRYAVVTVTYVELPADGEPLPAATPCTDDLNVCTDDVCDETGSCLHVPNAATCNDGLACNGADMCGGGTCSIHDGGSCVVCTNGSPADCNAPGTTVNPAAGFVDQNPPAGFVQCAGFTNTVDDDVEWNWENNCIPFANDVLYMRLFDDVTGDVLAGARLFAPVTSCWGGFTYRADQFEAEGFNDNPGLTCGDTVGVTLAWHEFDETFCGCSRPGGLGTCNDVFTGNAANDKILLVGGNSASHDYEAVWGPGTKNQCGTEDVVRVRVAIYAATNSCGDGVVEAGEVCDDGNLVDGDGCDSNCTVTACGNGVVTSPEQCDDGNLGNGDGCDEFCHAEQCVHDRCSTGSPLIADCDACVAQICAADPFCCTQMWDDLCVSEVASVCNEVCWDVSTTTTSSTSSTTTMPSDGTCDITFRLLDNSALVGALQFAADYTAAAGEFAGTGASVDCTSLIPGALPGANDVEAQRLLRLFAIHLSGFTGPLDMFRCTFATSGPPPVAGDFPIIIEDASDLYGSPISVTVGISEIVCGSMDVCGDGVVQPGEDCDDGNIVGGDCCSASCSLESTGSPCDDASFCTGADWCIEGACDGHDGNPCPPLTNCDEPTDQCTACVQLSLPASQRCVVGRDCTISVGVEPNGYAVASVASRVASSPATACAEECAVGAAAANGVCSVNPATCAVSVADLSLPITPFTSGEMARVVGQCVEQGSGDLCLLDSSAGSTTGLPLPVCEDGACVPFECAQCTPGDCNQAAGIEAADPICTVLCLIGQAPAQADCGCSADCNCLGGTEAADPICNVLRLIGAFSPDPCLSPSSAEIQSVAASMQAVRPAWAPADSGRVVVRLRGQEADQVGGIRVVLDAGSDANGVRLSRRLVRRGFHLEQNDKNEKDGGIALLITPPWTFPLESIGRGPVLRTRKKAGEVHIGAVEYGSTEGLPLRASGGAEKEIGE